MQKKDIEELLTKLYDDDFSSDGIKEKIEFNNNVNSKFFITWKSKKIYYLCTGLLLILVAVTLIIWKDSCFNNDFINQESGQYYEGFDLYKLYYDVIDEKPLETISVDDDCTFYLYHAIKMDSEVDKDVYLYKIIIDEKSDILIDSLIINNKNEEILNSKKVFYGYIGIVNNIEVIIKINGVEKNIILI